MLSTAEAHEIGMLENKLKAISTEGDKMRKLSRGLERGTMDAALGGPQKLIKLQLKIERLEASLRPIVKRLKRWVVPMMSEVEGIADKDGADDTGEEGSSGDLEGEDNFVEDNPENVARAREDYNRAERDFEECVQALEKVRIALDFLHLYRPPVSRGQ